MAELGGAMVREGKSGSAPSDVARWKMVVFSRETWGFFMALSQQDKGYPLVNFYITMENHHF